MGMPDVKNLESGLDHQISWCVVTMLVEAEQPEEDLALAESRNA